MSENTTLDLRTEQRLNDQNRQVVPNDSEQQAANNGNITKEQDDAIYQMQKDNAVRTSLASTSAPFGKSMDDKRRELANLGKLQTQTANNMMKSEKQFSNAVTQVRMEQSNGFFLKAYNKFRSWINSF